MLHKFIPAVYFHCTQHCAVRVRPNFSIYSSILDIGMISIICFCTSSKRVSYHNPIRPLRVLLLSHEETDTEELGDMPKVTHLVGGAARTHAQPV